MTIANLNEKYHKHLYETMGDQEMRYYLLSPLFRNLYDNKVVYHERFTALVQLTEIKLTPKEFSATAQCLTVIQNSARRKKPIPETWTIAASWAVIQLAGECLSAYSTWLIWPDPELVAKVVDLMNDNKKEDAYNLTMGRF